MDRQLRAGLAVRGWLEPAYYLLGSDFTGSSDVGSLSYMANMGGWGILDYGLRFAPEPWDWLQLDYASYLSSWALMNTGRADTNYGYWFPGAENDGASGWQFMTAKFGRAWIRKDVPRGPWHYDGEIDLGYGASLRMAATIVADDPLFGMIPYGGALTTTGGQIAVVPRDGLRQRFAVVGQGGTAGSAAARARESSKTSAGVFRLEVDRDGFAAEAPIAFDRELRRVAFTLENRTGDRHTTVLAIATPGAADQWEIRVDGRPVDLKPSAIMDYPLRAEIAMGPGSARVEMARR